MLVREPLERTPVARQGVGVRRRAQQQRGDEQLEAEQEGLVLATRVLDRGHDAIAVGLELVDGVVVERFALQGGDVTAEGVDRGRELPPVSSRRARQARVARRAAASAA